MLAVGALVTLLALGAAVLGWHAQPIVVAAVVAGSGLAVAGALLLRRPSAGQESRQALHDEQARVAAIVESAMDPIVTIDASQRIVLFNAAAEQVFGWTRAAVIGQPLDILIPQRVRPAHREHVLRFGRTGVTSRRMGGQSLLVGLRATGEEFPVEASISQHGDGDSKLYTVILRDVTQRVRSQQLLAQSEGRLRGIIESAMDAIITVDAGERVVLFNAAAEQVFRCPREQAIGAPLNGFIPERYRGSHTRHVRNFGASDSRSRRMAGQRVVMGLRRDGEEFPAEASISHIGEGDEKLYTVILRDVTERVRADEALRRSKDQLREFAQAAQSVREQEKSRIARELHDELGQALTALKLDVAWLKSTLHSEHAAAAKLDAMESMLNATVASTRRISSDLRPLILDDLGLVPALEWLVQNFTQRTGIVCNLSIGDPDMEIGDPHSTAIFRILQESLTNAAKHAKASRIDASLHRDASGIELRVRDDGVGFALDAPPRRDSYGLLGLRERAFLLGGEVHIDSAPGRGTAIEVRLPLGGDVSGV